MSAATSLFPRLSLSQDTGISVIPVLSGRSSFPSRSIDDVFNTVNWVRGDVTTGSGKVISDVEFPDFWSENAKIQVSEKYFRRADVPQFPEGIYDRFEASRRRVDYRELEKGGEKSLKYVVNRLVGTIMDYGIQFGYFASYEDASNFRNEMAYSMIHQYAALNSPQWFNTGLYWAYGIEGDAKGQYYYDFEAKQAVPSRNGYENPQAHACFILGVKDDLFGKNGIFDTAKREAQIFYFGSGSGSNYSTLRGKGEPVSGGGVSSGMMSFLNVYDVGGGVIKSGGKNRRAAKMDICDDTHPELIEFIQWKMRQEKMVRILIEAGMSPGFEDEAYLTVRGMNSNNTVSLSHKFFDAVERDEDWYLRWVSNPSHISKTLKARDIWDEIVYATWFSADPGIHATDTINEWHTCPKDGRIKSSNPCSEYLFLDETACNLASINLVKFFHKDYDNTQHFDTEMYRHLIRVWQIALDITVSMAQYPAQDICEKSMQYRTTGLGYTNLGGLLMLMGLGYDSDEGRQVAGALTAILGGESYSASSVLARQLGAYPAFERNREDHLRVVTNHRQAAYGKNSIDAARSLYGYKNVTIHPSGLNDEMCPPQYKNLFWTARQCWDEAMSNGKMWGYRNAQTTVLAPTGTISFAMDADTFGIEPDYALIKYKALAGGGYAVIVNRLIEPALRSLDYTDDQINDILEYVNKTGMVEDAPHLHPIYYKIFDTAVAARPGGRCLSPMAHVEMMAACQPFLSGAISKTVNLPESATEKEISDVYLYGYNLGLKAIAVYRANSKAASVMFTSADDLAKRETIDLGSHSFDVKKIFGGTHPLPIFLHNDDYVDVPIVTMDDNEMAEPIEMPTYGCKDGVCAI